MQLTLLNRPTWRRWLLKPLVFFAMLWPLADLAHGALTASLGADPQKVIMLATGRWALYSLILCLSMTPLRQLTGQPAWIAFRRMLGLFSFFYLCLHLTTFVVLYMGVEWRNIGAEIIERPYITVGMLAFLLMLPLAITSNRYSMRKLGCRWHKLHRLVYVTAVLGVWHYFWQVKSNLNQPVLFIFILSLLFGLRIYSRFFGGRQAVKSQ